MSNFTFKHTFINTYMPLNTYMAVQELDHSITRLYYRSSPHYSRDFVARGAKYLLGFFTQALILTLSILLLASSNSWAIQPPFELPASYELAKLKSATLMTSKGTLNFELFPEDAPWHVANFKYLADQGFYRGKSFHIMVDDFIIQAGANNDQRFSYFLPPEFSSHKHSKGTLGMARAPDDLNPQRNSSSTQFHILLSEAKRMDGSYAIFGRLIGGEEVLKTLRRGDKILDLKVFVSAE